MKKIAFKLLLAFIALAALTSRCKDNNNDVTTALVGNYTISSAVLAEPLPINTVEMGATTVPAKTPITNEIQAVLFSPADCTSAGNSLVELRKDNSLYISCAGQNAINAGTWEEPDATTLRLDLNSTAITSSPTGIELTVTDIVRYASGLRGQTRAPIPKAMVSALIASFGTPDNLDAPLTLDSSSPDIFNAVFYIYFLKE
jgi:hypothetical protein